MKHRRTHKEISNDKKDHYGGLAEAPPDKKASKKFRDPPYQAGKMILAHAGLHSVRWIDVVDYMEQHVMDGSIKLSDPVPRDLDKVLSAWRGDSDGH